MDLRFQDFDLLFIYRKTIRQLQKQLLFCVLSMAVSIISRSFKLNVRLMSFVFADNYKIGFITSVFPEILENLRIPFRTATFHNISEGIVIY